MGCCCSALMKRSRGTFSSNYKLDVGPVGIGNFGNFRTCVHQKRKKRYLVKVTMVNDVGESARDLTSRKIEEYSRLKQKNIAKYYGDYFESGFRYRVFQEIQGKYLFAEICSKTRYSENDARRYIRQILRAVRYCHRKNIVHKNLNPTNILLQPPGDIKLIDVGLTLVARENVGCRWYTAPELHTGSEYEKSIDMWACGMILYNLLSGKHPLLRFRDNGNIVETELNQMTFHRDDFTDISSQGIELVQRLLSFDSSQRIPSERASNHAFFSGADYSTRHMDSTVRNLGLLHKHLLESFFGFHCASNTKGPSPTDPPEASELSRDAHAEPDLNTPQCTISISDSSSNVCTEMESTASICNTEPDVPCAGDGASIDCTEMESADRNVRIARSESRGADSVAFGLIEVQSSDTSFGQRIARPESPGDSEIINVVDDRHTASPSLNETLVSIVDIETIPEGPSLARLPSDRSLDIDEWISPWTTVRSATAMCAALSTSMERFLDEAQV